MKNLHKQLFAVITIIFLCYVSAFLIIQHYREESYKEKLAGVRVTIINKQGEVVMDTEHKPTDLTNHMERPEVQQALQEGYGYDIRRTSETDGETYFYSATFFPENGQIIRSAIPYPSSKGQAHTHHSMYIGISIAIFILLSIVLFVYTRNVGKRVDYTINDYKRQIREAEEDKARIKHDLTQNTAHELKTPLASISGYLETLTSHPDLPVEKRQYFLDKCTAQTQRMTNLLSDMSTLTRLDNMLSISIDKQPVDIADIARQAIEDVTPILEQKHMLLTCHMPAHLPAIGDQNLLYSVFRNILDNAISYSSASCITVTGNEQYQFTIADNGIGVEAQHLPHLFERFYRVDKGRSRDMGGTGLGLAIVKNAISLHGGTCSATSTIPHGLTIHFSLLPNNL